MTGLYGNGRRRQRRRSGPGGPLHTYAAIDLGSNNCRLLVARPSHEGFRVIDAFSRIVRLGEGVHVSGELSQGAIERTIEALHVCAAKMKRRGVDRARCIATEACRRAGNGDHFLSRVREETGIELEIIAPDEEVRLALAGCLPLIEPWARHVAVLDIGGGSTEISWLAIDEEGDHTLEAWVSLPCGVVSLAESQGGDRIDDATYRAMVGHVETLLAPFEERHGFRHRLAGGTAQIIGTSGTVTTLAGVHLNLPHYDRRQVDGTTIGYDALDAVIGRLRSMALAERASVPCIGHDRADLVVAGAAILDAVRGLWPVGRLSVADRGLREGVLLGLIDQDRNLGQRSAGDAAVSAPAFDR